MQTAERRKIAFEEFDYLVKNAEKVFSKLWSSKKDDAWDNA